MLFLSYNTTNHIPASITPPATQKNLRIKNLCDLCVLCGFTYSIFHLRLERPKFSVVNQKLNPNETP